MIEAGNGIATTTFAYSHDDQRIKKTSGGVDTIYVNKFYEKQGATTTSYIWAGNTLVATIERNDQATSTTYAHTDHLNSVAVTTDENGNVKSVKDFYPYGSERISTGDAPDRAFVSRHFDDELDLSYLTARYYSGDRGQFTSQDPVHLAIGNPNSIQALTGASQQQLLSDPQLLNSYAYGRGNPIRYSDPDGKYIEISGSIVIPGRAFSTGIRFDSTGADFFMGGGFGYGAGGGVEVAWAPGVSLSHQREANINVGGQFAYGVGGRVTQNVITYSPDQQKRIPNSSPVGSLVLGAGGGVYVQEELSAPIPSMSWGNQNNRTNSTIQRNQTQTFQNQTTNNSRNITPSQTSAGGSSSLGKVMSNLQSALSKLSSALQSLTR
jgi:RHS repeat-associated protein